MTSRFKINVLLAGSAFVIGLVAALMVMREPMEPLTAESLRRGLNQWQHSGIKSYNLRYRMHGGEYDVQVRDGVVTQLLLNGRPPASAQRGSYSMEGLFDILGLEVENLSDPAGPFAANRNSILARVRFNKKFGYIERYLRSSGGFGRGAVIEMITFERVVE